MTQDTPAALPGTIAKGPLHAIHASPAVRDALLAYHDRPADDEAAAVVSAILAHQAATSAAGGATVELTDEVQCHLEAAANALEWITKRQRQVGDTLEPVSDIRMASKLAAEGYRRIGLAMTAIDAALAAQSPDSGAGPGEPTIYLRADGPHEEAKGTACPVTGRPYFMHLTHPELGQVPTYGGPYDSYTAPYAEGDPLDPWHERELTVHRYDHDRGHWVEDEGIPLRIIHEEVLFKLEEDAARAKPAALAQQGAQNG